MQEEEEEAEFACNQNAKVRNSRPRQQWPRFNLVGQLSHKNERQQSVIHFA